MDISYKKPEAGCTAIITFSRDYGDDLVIGFNDYAIPDPKDPEVLADIVWYHFFEQNRLSIKEGKGELTLKTAHIANSTVKEIPDQENQTVVHEIHTDLQVFFYNAEQVSLQDYIDYKKAQEEDERRQLKDKGQRYLSADELDELRDIAIKLKDSGKIFRRIPDGEVMAVSPDDGLSHVNKGEAHQLMYEENASTSETLLSVDQIHYRTTTIYVTDRDGKPSNIFDIEQISLPTPMDLGMAQYIIH
tara:strand:+ start:3119 stop:3856 length:738 start_codon:yes stop_codon:yes gene_type:complete